MRSARPLKITIMNSAAVVSAESTASRKREGSLSGALPRGEIVVSVSLPASSDISLRALQAGRESRQVELIPPFVGEQNGGILFKSHNFRIFAFIFYLWAFILNHSPKVLHYPILIST